VRTGTIEERNDGEIPGPQLSQKLRWRQGMAHTPEAVAATRSVQRQHESQRPNLMMALGSAGMVGRRRWHRPRHAARGWQHGRAADEHASSRGRRSAAVATGKAAKRSCVHECYIYFLFRKQNFPLYKQSYIHDRDTSIYKCMYPQTYLAQIEFVYLFMIFSQN
jgi:hypothetical protein